MLARTRTWPFAALLLGVGCGGSVDVHAVYGRIQVEEARIAHGTALGPPDCEAVCDASASIDREARSLEHDADARERADRAARTCAACREAP